ncbi:MAG TPA: peptide chain release factor 1 [Candidatus Omnitrophica bacterium]|nr:peptide chain release factor 1 [Candidatus Omnitrophota bacterium]
MDIIKKGERLQREYTRIMNLLAKPEVIRDATRLKDYSRSLRQIEPKVKKFKEYRETISEIHKLQELLKKEEDSEMILLAQEELESLESKKKLIEQQLEDFLKPHAKEEEGNVIMEIRAGTGGEEASLFARDLFRMYSKFAEKRGWKIDLMHSNFSERGGFKEVVYAVEGDGVWKDLRYESGVHRVQRVPQTESGGRIHTSTATVAVLPEVGEVEIKINPQDLKIETYRASGPGGQHVNVTDSAVRIIHIPSEIKVQCQDERSQHQNKARALRILKAKLLHHYKMEKEREILQTRRSQIKTGERSEKIRTYNFPQGRITDHRINFTLYKLKEVLEGELDLILEPLKAEGVSKRNGS